MADFCGYCVAVGALLVRVAALLLPRNLPPSLSSRPAGALRGVAAGEQAVADWQLARRQNVKLRT